MQAGKCWYLTKDIQVFILILSILSIPVKLFWALEFMGKKAEYQISNTEYPTEEGKAQSNRPIQSKAKQGLRSPKITAQSWLNLIMRDQLFN